MFGNASLKVASQSGDTYAGFYDTSIEVFPIEGALLGTPTVQSLTAP